MRNPNGHVDQDNPFAVTATVADVAYTAEDSARTSFIRRTYATMTGAVLALIVIEAILLTVVPHETMTALTIRMTSGFGWLIVLGAFMGVSWMARMWAHSDTSPAVQYAGLGLYVLAEAVILLPMLYICVRFMNAPELPILAGVITGMCFIGLTAFVFVTKVDLTSWGKYLALAGILAMCAIVAGIITGFSSMFGLGFSAIMVGLACGYILYDTSNIMRHYRTDQHVAAALALFSSVVLLFWYVLRILMIFASDD